MSTRRALLLVGRRLLGPSDSAATLEALAGPTFVHAREMSTRGRGRFRGARRPVGKAAPPPALEDPWEEVKDETTGQTYWWNVQTNETTALGAPKPMGTTSLAPSQQQGAPPPVGQPPQQRSMMGAFGSMVAEGMAFGTGSAIAHRAIGSIFGGGGYGYGGGYGGGGSAAGGPPAPGSAPEVPPSDAAAGGSSMWGAEFDADSDSSDGGGWGDVFDGWDE